MVYRIAVHRNPVEGVVQFTDLDEWWRLIGRTAGRPWDLVRAATWPGEVQRLRHSDVLCDPYYRATVPRGVDVDRIEASLVGTLIIVRVPRSPSSR